MILSNFISHPVVISIIASFVPEGQQFSVTVTSVESGCFHRVLCRFYYCFIFSMMMVRSDAWKIAFLIWLRLCNDVVFSALRQSKRHHSFYYFWRFKMFMSTYHFKFQFVLKTLSTYLNKQDDLLNFSLSWSIHDDNPNLHIYFIYN